MSGIAWPALMRAGLRDLGLKPSEFWSLTPAELTVMLDAGARNDALDRSGFDALLAAFPDDVDEEKARDDGP